MNSLQSHLLQKSFGTVTNEPMTVFLHYGLRHRQHLACAVQEMAND